MVVETREIRETMMVTQTSGGIITITFNREIIMPISVLIKTLTNKVVPQIFISRAIVTIRIIRSKDKATHEVIQVEVIQVVVE